MSVNIKVEPVELQFIRLLDDFDLKMVLSEINDHGWPAGRKLLHDICAAMAAKSGGVQ